MTGTAYLVGSGEANTLQAVARRARAGLNKEKLRIAASFAAIAGEGRGLGFMQRGLTQSFPGSTVERFAVEGEGADMDPKVAARIVAEADLVFVSGGDPALGAKLLTRAGADAWIVEARARGAAVLGVSAGSIMLGAYWAEWEEGDEATPVRCTGAVPDLVVDCHDEASDWEELRAVKALLSREPRGKGLRYLGIPAGGAVVVDGSGSITHEGRRSFAL